MTRISRDRASEAIRARNRVFLTKTALVANHGDGSVSVIDLNRARVTANFHAGTGIEALTYY